MAKISKTHHITKKGTIKRNPRLKKSKDWKQVMNAKVKGIYEWQRVDRKMLVRLHGGLGGNWRGYVQDYRDHNRNGYHDTVEICLVPNLDDAFVLLHKYMNENDMASEVKRIAKKYGYKVSDVDRVR